SSDLKWEPAEDRVAAEADDVAAATGAFLDERVVEPVEVAGHLFGAAPPAERSYELDGQGGEAGDVGEEHAAFGTVRSGGQGSAPTVLGRVRPEDLGYLCGAGRPFHPQWPCYAPGAGRHQGAPGAPTAAIRANISWCGKASCSASRPAPPS